MTPTMSEYFGQWKQSRFIAGGKAKEDSFAASSRLQDIESILSGTAANPGHAGLTLRADAVFLAPGAFPRHLPAAFELDLGG